MATFRVESVFDHNTAKFYVELYYPDTASVPLVRTAPIYSSHEAAEADTIKLMKNALPSQPVRKV